MTSTATTTAPRATVSTGTADDIDWLTVHAGRFFPAEWREFREHVPAELREERLADAYNTLLMDPNPAVREAAAVAWCRWEEAHVATSPRARPNPRYGDARFRLGFARQVTHCWRHNSWLAQDEIVRNAARLAGIPGWLIHGRLDVSSPLDAPWRIHQAWPDSELIIVDDEGHGGETMRCTGAAFSLTLHSPRSRRTWRVRSGSGVPDVPLSPAGARTRRLRWTSASWTCHRRSDHRRDRSSPRRRASCSCRAVFSARSLAISCLASSRRCRSDAGVARSADGMTGAAAGRSRRSRMIADRSSGWFRATRVRRPRRGRRR